MAIHRRDADATVESGREGHPGARVSIALYAGETPAPPSKASIMGVLVGAIRRRGRRCDRRKRAGRASRGTCVYRAIRGRDARATFKSVDHGGFWLARYAGEGADATDKSWREGHPVACLNIALYAGETPTPPSKASIMGGSGWRYTRAGRRCDRRKRAGRASSGVSKYRAIRGRDARATFKSVDHGGAGWRYTRARRPRHLQKRRSWGVLVGAIRGRDAHATFRSVDHGGFWLARYAGEGADATVESGREGHPVACLNIALYAGETPTPPSKASIIGTPAPHSTALVRVSSQGRG